MTFLFLDLKLEARLYYLQHKTRFDNYVINSQLGLTRVEVELWNGRTPLKEFLKLSSTDDATQEYSVLCTPDCIRNILVF